MEHLEYNKFNALKNKLDDFLGTRHLVGFMQTESYPITYTICSDHTLDAQLSMLEEDPSGIFVQNAKLIFIFADGEVTFKTVGRASIPDADLCKIKNLVKKMHYAFLQTYFLDMKKALEQEKALEHEAETSSAVEALDDIADEEEVTEESE